MLRRERSPSAYWMGGWVSAAIGGLLLLLGERWPALTAVSLPFGTLFPWFVLAGSLALAEWRVPRWLLPLGLVLGGLRASLAVAGLVPLAHSAGFVTDLP